jgi:hypothetical protein
MRKFIVAAMTIGVTILMISQAAAGDEIAFCDNIRFIP